MNNEKTWKEKIKEFFKKYWGYIATFVGGIVSVALYKFGVSGRFNTRNNDFGNTLEHLTTGLERAEDGVSGLTNNNREATNLIHQQRTKIDGIRERHSNIEDASQGIGESIQRLKNLIEREREKTTKTGD